MKKRGIIMSAPMVRALLDGSKTQTRRILKLKHSPCIASDGRGGYVECDGLLNQWPLPCPYGVAGDRLWVRERHIITNYERASETIAGKKVYRLFGFIDKESFDVFLTPKESKKFHRRKRKKGCIPSIFMFRSLSRITLEITGVRVEKLQDISEEDAKAEGVEAINLYPINVLQLEEKSYVAAYRVLWDSLHGKGAWKLNPWVWVLEFERA